MLLGGVVGGELRADREHDVGGADDLVGARPAERAHHAGGERIGLVEHALAAGRGGDRDVEGPGQLGELRPRLADAHPVAGDDHRAGRAVEGGHRAGECRRVDGVGRTGQVGGGRVDARRGLRSDLAAQGAGVEDHRHRPRLTREGVLEGQLHVLHGLRRVVADHHPLRHAGQCAAGVPRAVVGGAALVRRVVRERPAVAHLGEDQDRRAAHHRLEEALPGVAGDPLALAHHDQRLAGEATVGLGHRGADRLLAHLDRADRRVLVEPREDRPRVAARHPEHVAHAGLGQDVHDGVGDPALLLQWLRRHARPPRCSACGCRRLPGRP